MFHSRHEVPLVPRMCLLLLLNFVSVNFSFELLEYLFARTQKGYLSVCMLHFAKMPPTLRVLSCLTIPPGWQDGVYNCLKYLWLNVLIYSAATSIWESHTSFTDSAELIRMVSGARDVIHSAISLVRSLRNPELSMGPSLALQGGEQLRSRCLHCRQVKLVEKSFAWSSWLVQCCRDRAVTNPGNLSYEIFRGRNYFPEHLFSLIPEWNFLHCLVPNWATSDFGPIPTSLMEWEEEENNCKPMKVSS